MTTAPVLVFGDDGSPAADIGWLFVNSHRWPGWRVEVVEAHMPESAAPPPDATLLHQWVPQQPRHAFVEAEFAEVVHLTATADPRVVLSRDCDLLVIGPRGPGLLKSLHLGSTADWLLLHPPAPLLIARHGQPLRGALLCTDGSPHARRAAAALAALPLAAQLDVTVLAIDDGRTDVAEAIRVASDLLRPVVAAVSERIEVGKPTSQIERHLERSAPDLVVLGTRGLTGLRHLRLGSTASAIARTATCSVLVACDDNTSAPSLSTSG
jgi:nucleotide-binding universal stress UspA family protein